MAEATARTRLPACLVLFLLLLALAGCAGKEKKQAELQQAYAAGQLTAIQQMQSQQPFVTVRGLVRKPRVTWSEGLTLAQTLVDAEYQGLGTPFEISIRRKSQIIKVNPRKLLNGQDNPLLEPGDIVELR